MVIYLVFDELMRNDTAGNDDDDDDDDDHSRLKWISVCTFVICYNNVDVYDPGYANKNNCLRKIHYLSYCETFSSHLQLLQRMIYAMYAACR